MAGEWRSNTVPAEKSVLNMIQLMLSVSDWRIIMIGPDGLLLVVPSPICCRSLSFMGATAEQ
jgi:hypothetical protein